MIEFVRISRSMYSRKARQPPNASGTPQRGKLRVKVCVRAECSPRVAPVQERRVRRDRQQQRQHRAQAIADPHRAVDVADPHVHVQAERVVAPGDVLEAVLDAVVVLGVDDRAARGSRPTGGSRSRRARRRAQRPARTAPAALALAARARRARSAPAPGDDLDLRGDQLAGDLLVQQRIVAARGVAQLLEARRQLERGAARGSRTPPRGRR